MKIILSVYSFAGGLRAIAHFWLKAEKPRIFTVIDAIVDTGSPDTIISAADLKKARVSPIQVRKLAGKIEKFDYCGGQMETLPLNSAKLLFKEGELTMPILVSLKETDNKPKPSIIGVDFLLNNKFKFFFDPINKEAYFEN